MKLNVSTVKSIREKLLVAGLLFLQRQARSEEFKTRVALVSSQAGCVRFRSITGQNDIYGKFDAPEQLGQRVLRLSSDQNKNSILVSGDTTGCLQIWDISSFALELQHERQMTVLLDSGQQTASKWVILGRR
ncbi:hypothetical protein OJAV_G00188390 [Oryzias javanicus]|uniref:Uncharacterized protein n=1 Tax=Oryzias javanicus TaxID=123683 RepID=A0A3S2MHU7_ORYJA|nr:hypothetical protein OJAV_G00188390 [Oryzias javanicus]